MESVVMRRVRVLLAVGLILLTACSTTTSTGTPSASAPTSSASASGTGLQPDTGIGEGSTPSFNVSLVVEPGGNLGVTEHITYTFYSAGHGIQRIIPDRYPYPSDANHVLRVLTISHLKVSSPSGAPTEVLQRQARNYLDVRVGSPTQLVSGTQEYVLAYDVAGALTSLSGQVELSWNAIPALWSSPIAHAHVTVTAPAIRQVDCYAGSVGSKLPCDRFGHTKTRAWFDGSQLGKGSGLTVVVDMPAGTVRVPPVKLHHAALASPQPAFPIDSPTALIGVTRGGGHRDGTT
jgi:hypothetical protein